MKINQTEKYINWNKSKTTRSSLVPDWDPNLIDVPWTEVIQTEEVVVGDPWDIYTTELKHQLADLHAEWSIPRESVKHYMSLRPQLNKGLETALAPFEKYTHNYSLLKLTAGHMIVWHFDTYATFVKHNNISQQDADKIKRSIVMLTPWSFGHVLQIGSEVISGWSVGDIITWSSDTWHGACNFGRDDFTIMQVTYIE
jgi:hypothetical protein